MSENADYSELVEQLRGRTYSQWSSVFQAVEEFEDELATEAAEAIATLTAALDQATRRAEELQDERDAAVQDLVSIDGHDDKWSKLIRCQHERDSLRDDVKWGIINIDNEVKAREAAEAYSATLRQALEGLIAKLEQADAGLANAYSSSHDDYQRDSMACERIGLQKAIKIARADLAPCPDSNAVDYRAVLEEIALHVQSDPIASKIITDALHAVGRAKE